ncbi:MAG: GWxTD domain-containing protein [Candidatus Krumholzibacteria bacterium]|nr:GWxTD domain-containing protein [Candidatus Krumholzibacteria bacterium]
MEEGDFLEPVAIGEKREVWRDIADLKERVEADFGNAELHRQLAVLYRLAGTPRSRLLSSEEIDKAVSLDPQNPILHVERGLTLAARRFVGEAEASFTRAAQIDPRCFDAWFQLGRLEQYEYYKTMCFVDRLSKAIEYFEKAFRIDKKNEETLENLAYLYSFRQMYQTGLKYGTRAVQYHPKSAAAHLVCGMLYTRRKDFEKAQKEFSSAFLLMSEEERHPYDHIAPLLQSDERDLYLSSSDVKQQDWNRRFWIENDPTPATELNERMLEHYARVTIADRAFSDERRNARGSETDRGAAMIRFGLPDRKLYDLGGGTSGGWIVWQYSLSKSYFNLYFNDEFLNGDYHFPITDYYGTASLRMLNTIPQRYAYPIEYRPFPISLEIAELRGADERTRLEMSVALPDSLGGTPGASWDIFVTFFDSERDRFSRDRIPFKPDSLPVIAKGGGVFRVCNFSIEMLPRQLECTCVFEIVNEKDHRKGSRRVPLEIREMYGRSLKLSSLKFTIPDAAGSCSTILDPIPLYRRKGTLCLSYEVYNLQVDENGRSRYRVSYSIRKPDPDDEQSGEGIRKTLAYMWSSAKGKKGKDKPYIESSIEQGARAGTAADNLQIDIGALEKGVYVLVLGVEDLAAGTSAVESRIFTVSE